MFASRARAVSRWSLARVAGAKTASRRWGAAGPRRTMSTSRTAWAGGTAGGRVMTPWRVEVGWGSEGELVAGAGGKASNGTPRSTAQIPAALPMWLARWSAVRDWRG